MTKLKEVFIYNETYPLPEEAYQYFKGKVVGCSNNPMCLNNAKSEVESYISKWGRKSGIKIENGDESSFTILTDKQDFNEEVKDQNTKRIKIETVAFLVILITSLIAIIKKQIVFGVIAGVVFMLVFGKLLFKKETETPETVEKMKKEANEVSPSDQTT